MANQFVSVQEPSSPTKKMQTFENTISSVVVEAEAVTLVDSTGAEKVGAKTAANSIPVAAATDQLIALGQATMIGSVPVTVASDQPAMKPLATLVEQESLAPTSIAALSAEATNVTGSTVLAGGQMVQFSLAGEPILETSAGEFVYVAIKGATSNAYYAVAYDNETISGVFFVTTAEKLNIVTRNSDAKLACVFSGYWAAMKP